ncbi:hypothetical protein SERLA73DRAFT_127859 [Serpula lacrymans var. lacrymans S7.3]|uniref:Mediator of RNA polymerase II transcription subunit 4 n=1 Tax=Serpula lacrymans var. lacrymans (strain S7.3) TaxID=936435 RepID=F8QI82_SERL3|nr:hypothetical protein SERLA73DRAFT_127859 [Serpula lacrymans var. lacrymans S7.3]
MNAILLKPLNEFQTLSQTLFASFCAPQTKPPPAPSAQAFLECDATLADALKLALVHQRKQRRIEKIKNEILTLELTWREICAQLELGKRDLETVIDGGDERIKAIEEAKKASIPYPELLAYAQSLSAFTSAPPNMPDFSAPGPGQPPPSLFFPPFPNEEKMRRGRLNAEAPLGQLGETHSVGRPPTISPSVAEPSRQMGHAANPYRQDLRPQDQIYDLDLDLNPDL